MNKSLEVILALYSNSALEAYICDLREGVFSHLTDTVTLFAALAAIALPLAQQTFQWASDKYRSDLLIDYIESSSPIHPKKLNRRLITYVAIVFSFKLTEHWFNDITFVVLLMVLVAIFASNMYRLIEYLSHTYDMGKGLKVVRQKILNKKLNLDEDMYTEIEIAILSDYESYTLETDPTCIDFSAEFTELRQVLSRREKDIDEKVLAAYLKGLRKAVSHIPVTASDKKYNFVVQSYLFLVQSLICTDSKYFYLLLELAEVAESVEPRRKGFEKPLLQGLVFQNVTYSRDWPEGLAGALVSHFKRLTQACINSAQSDQLVHLYKEFNASLGLNHVTRDSLQYYFHSYIDDYEHFKIVDEYVERFLKSESDLLPAEFVEVMIPLLKGTDKEKQELLDDFFSEFRNYEYQQKGQSAAESFLADAAKTDVKIILAIRECRNPISSTIHMLGYDLIPTSIGGIVTNISRIDSSNEDRFFRDNKHNQHLLKAYVTLLIYEVCKTIESSLESNYQFLNQLSFRELEKLKLKLSGVTSLQKSLMNTQCFIDLFFLHAIDSSKASERVSAYIAGLLGAIEERLSYLLEHGKLDQKAVERFLNSVPESDGILSKNSHLLSKKVKVSQCSKHKYHIEFGRSNFLPDTGTFYDFSRIGANVIERHFDWIYQSIFEVSEGFELENAWPVNHGRLVLLSFSHQKELRKYGFSFVEDIMHWPDGGTCLYHRIHSEDDKVVSILMNDNLVQVSGINDPIYEVNYIDLGGTIRWEFTMNIMPYGYK
ncbi:hypothetical protein [Vibrio splendidus]|uniref:Uncharacterized protein n=1 Tax=Vibrio splendidus TaxID=29497 RepID=A0A2N7JNU0_VIBSP|nr:hypothetical protein [Vibrio splendidus]PMM44174.1 hypothetical protein BCT54_05055 [Vibrio splendidus]